MYLGGFGFDMAYIGIAIVSLILGLVTQGYIKSSYRKWSQVPASHGISGADMARRMLVAGGASDVGIGRIPGELTDHYDPRDNSLHLSQENFSGGSVASIAVACHEAGHAVQAAQGYGFYRFRTALVPVVNFASQAWGLLFIAGIFLHMLRLMQVAVILFAVSVLFQLVTLPVEIDASRRAVRFLNENGSAVDQQGAKQVLTAAALTYVASALISILQLLYYLSRTNSRD